MTGYRLIIKPAAERDIARLPQSLQRRVVEAIARIQQAPHGRGSVKLSGTKSTYRLRVGDWRIIYELDGSTKHIYVTVVAHRRDVYR